MEPHFAINDLEMFYRYLKNINVYFEYGSGGSTYYANNLNNIKKIYSVESDIEWYNKLKQKITNPKFHYIYNEMDTPPKKWGCPGKNATNIQKINYSNHITKLSKEEQVNIDLVLIDGRFRVACCLKCYDSTHDDCIIIFDDFLIRPHYNVVLEYFDIIEKTKDNRMVILKKKKNVPGRRSRAPPKALIEKYELIKD